MAKEIDKLYVSIGVNTDDLKVGFEKSDQTINQYVSKLNQQSKNIKLKMDIDLSKLELSGSELDKLKVKAKALQDQLDIAKQKQSISAQTLSLNTQKYGADSAITRKSQTIDLYRQKDVANLENELAKVNKELDKLTPKSQSAFNKLGTSAKQAAGSMSGLTASITSLNAKWTAALAVIGTGAGFLNLTESAMKAGEQLYQIQNRLKITAQEAGQLKKLFSMSDSDIMTLPSFLARLDKSYTQAGESGKAFRETLDAYGIKLTDSNGKLLGTTQQLEQLAIGLENARKTGDEESFSMDVLGARGQQLIPVLDQMATKMDLIKKTGSTGLLNAQEAHDLYLRFQQLQLQVGDLKGAIGKALLPIAEEMMPSLIEVTKEFCNVIKDNKDSIRDAIQGWGSVFGTLTETIGGAAKAIGELIKAYNDLDFIKSSKMDEEILKRIYKDENHDKARDWNTLIGGAVGGFVGGRFGGTKGAAVGAGIGSWAMNKGYTWAGKLFTSDEEWNYYKQQIELEQKEAEQKKKTQKAIDDKKKAEKEATDATKANTDSTKANTDAHKDSASAITARRAATRELRKELTELTNSDYDNKLAVLNKKVEEFKEKGVDDKLLSDYYNASLARLNEDITESVLNPISSAFKSDFQNQLDEIDAQARRYKKQAGSALSDNTLNSWIQRRKSEITSDWDKQVAEQIDSVWKTELDNQLSRIEREKQAWIKKGLDEVKATQWAEQQKRQAVNDSVKNMFTSQKKYLQLYRNAMAGQVSAEGGMYDFTQSQGDRQQNAIKAIRRLMMQEAGVSPNEKTSMAEIQGFQEVMKAANMWGASLVRDSDGNAYNFSDLASTITESGSQTNSILSQINSEVPQINSNLLNVRDAVSNISINPGFTIKDVTDLYKNSAEQKTEQKETDVSVKTDSTELINKLTEITNTINNEIPSISSNIASLKTSLDNFIIQPATDNNSIRIVELMENQNSLLMQQNVDIPSINTNLMNLLNAVQNNSTANNSTGLNELSNNFSQYSSNISRVLESINDSIPSINVNLSGILERMNQNRQVQPPQINVSPNINVNLGGAYVFDNAMKQQLTDDITREVANGVTQAVNEATSQIQTGFAS